MVEKHQVNFGFNTLKPNSKTKAACPYYIIQGTSLHHFPEGIKELLILPLDPFTGQATYCICLDLFNEASTVGIQYQREIPKILFWLQLVLVLI